MISLYGLTLNAGGRLPDKQCQYFDVDPGQPHADFDFLVLVGLPVHEAESAAAEAGFTNVRVLEYVGERLIGAMDMSIQPNRLNLEVEGGRVRHVHFGA